MVMTVYNFTSDTRVILPHDGHGGGHDRHDPLKSAAVDRALYRSVMYVGAGVSLGSFQIFKAIKSALKV